MARVLQRAAEAGDRRGCSGVGRSARAVVSPRWIFRTGEEPPPGVRPEEAPAGGVRAHFAVVSPGFFDVMSLRIVAGRDFRDDDDEGADPAVVVSRRLAAALWPGENPLGRLISLPAGDGPRRPPMLVVGVADDVRLASIFDDPPVAYVPAAHPDHICSCSCGAGGTGRARGDARAMGRPSARACRVHPGVGELIDAQTPATRRERLDRRVRRHRALLAAVGLYGVVTQESCSACGSWPCARPRRDAGGSVSLVISQDAHGRDRRRHRRGRGRCGAAGVADAVRGRVAGGCAGAVIAVTVVAW